MPDQTCDEEAGECQSECDENPDADADGFDAVACGGNDCDDSNPSRYPGNTEICDADHVDEDCDPTTYGERDVDGDGFVDLLCCNYRPDGDPPMAGETSDLLCGRDCDDERPDVHPGESETCNGRDDDCDGSVDLDGDENVCDCTMLGLIQVCGESEGECMEGTRECMRTGWGMCEGEVTPAVETCNGLDDDCDAAMDENAVEISTGVRVSDDQIDHCGACGTSCTVSSNRDSTSANCSTGSCTLDCLTGYDDCDGTYGNGCEVQLSVGRRVNDDRVDDCGGCGSSGANSCRITSNTGVSRATCVSGDCGMTCTDGRDDCDGNYANGCETNTNTDPNHCDGCGLACEAEEQCSGGTCTLGVWYGQVVWWPNSTTMAGQHGTATFTGSTGYQFRRRTHSGTLIDQSGTFSLQADNRFSATHAGNTYTGQLSVRGDLMVMTDTAVDTGSRRNLRYQGVWVRKGSGHVASNLNGDWYVASYSDLSGGSSGSASPFGAMGMLSITGGSAMSYDLDVTVPGEPDEMNTGTASIAADGGVTIDLDSPGGYLRGYINEFNDVMVLRYDSNLSTTDGFRPGTFVLVKRSGGRGTGNVQGSYFVSHLASSNRAIWGELTTGVGGGGFASGGFFAASDGQMFSVCVSGSAISVEGSSGAISMVIPNGTSCPGMFTSEAVGQAQVPNGAFSDVLNAHVSDDLTVPSLMVWVRKP